MPFTDNCSFPQALRWAPAINQNQGAFRTSSRKRASTILCQALRQQPPGLHKPVPVSSVVGPSADMWRRPELHARKRHVTSSTFEPTSQTCNRQGVRRQYLRMSQRRYRAQLIRPHNLQHSPFLRTTLCASSSERPAATTEGSLEDRLRALEISVSEVDNEDVEWLAEGGAWRVRASQDGELSKIADVQARAFHEKPALAFLDRATFNMLKVRKLPLNDIQLWRTCGHSEIKILEPQDVQLAVTL